MNEQSQTVLNEYVKIDPIALSTEQLDFIRARRDYLNRQDRKTYAKVIADRDEEVKKLLENPEE